MKAQTLIPTLVLLTAFAWAQPSGVQVPLSDGTIGWIDWAIGGALRVDGYGCATVSISHEGGSRETAIRAAHVVAQRRLLELIQTLGLSGGITMRDVLEASEAVRGTVQGVLRGAQIVEGSERWTDDRCLVLTIAVPLAALRTQVPQLPYAAHLRPAAPVAFDDLASVLQGGVTVIHVLENDVQHGAHEMYLRVVEPPEHGVATVEANGTVRYRHDGGSTTVDRLSYQIESRGIVSNEAVVRVHVVRRPEPVIAHALDAEISAGDDHDGSVRDTDDTLHRDPGSSAQTDEDADALERIDAALQAQSEALAHAHVASPDDARWRRAISLAQEAVDHAPDATDATLVLARTLSFVGWHSRAWTAWSTHLAGAGGFESRTSIEAHTTSIDLFTRTATVLGYSRYEAGAGDDALVYFQSLLRWNPDHGDAVRWIARIHFEAGRFDESRSYLLKVLEQDPTDAGAQISLARSERSIAYGPTASDAFHAGASAYEVGHLTVALEHFEEAVHANDTFVDAWVWAGRTSMELGLPDRSRHHWDAVLVLDPTDERARYFRDLAVAQARWGVPAADAFYAGQLARQRGRPDEAADHFVAATLMNDGYLAAWEWAAHTYQELGAYEEALVYWQALLQRDAGYERAEYHRNVALQLVGRSRDAGQALTDAITAYQNADFEAAEAHVLEAIGADPEYPEAWAWLGRLHFVLASYEEAATGYEQAYALEPDNDDYRFFMEEARWLATTRM